MIYTVTAGHGGASPGNTWHGEREADLMRELRFIVALILRQAGHTVREDGARDQNWPLPDAMRLVQGSALAIELHTNASNNQTATGVEVVAGIPHARHARALAHAIGGVLQIPTRRDGGWYPHAQYIRDRGESAGFVRAGGLIVEVFFQSNLQELRTYKERVWLVARAIARAVEESTK